MNFPLGCGQQVALWGDGWTHQAQCAGGRFGQGCLLLPHVQQAQPQAFLVVRTDGDPVSLSTAIREAVRSVDAGQPVYSLASMDQHIANSLGPRRFAVHLLGLFAGIAVLMAALGLYGVIRYTVAQRTQEIGIRMTLGAQRAQVLSLVVGHALRLAVAGVVAGAVARPGWTRWRPSVTSKTAASRRSRTRVLSRKLVAKVLIEEGLGRSPVRGNILAQGAAAGAFTGGLVIAFQGGKCSAGFDFQPCGSQGLICKPAVFPFPSVHAFQTKKDKRS